MPLQLRNNAGTARAHETVRIRSRRPRRRCNNNRHCVYAVEDNQDGPPSNNEQEARAEHAVDADPLDNSVHNVPTTDRNLAPAESPLHIAPRADTRAPEQTTAINTPDPNLQRRLDQLARTQREPTQHGPPAHDRTERQRKEIPDALKTLLERARTTERNTDHIIDAVRTAANRNVEAVQERARDDRRLVLELSEQVRDIDRQLDDLTRIVENTRSELGNLIDYEGAGPDRMEHDFSIYMSGIPNAEATTIRPSSLCTLIEQINTTTDQVFSRLSAWNDNVFSPVNAFGLNAVLTILRTQTEYFFFFLV
jgi:hypothetical protein